MAEDEDTALIPRQLDSLQKAGLNKEQINIVVHNLDKMHSTRIIARESIEIVVNNPVKDEKFQSEFFTNPPITIKQILTQNEVM